MFTRKNMTNNSPCIPQEKIKIFSLILVNIIGGIDGDIYFLILRTIEIVFFKNVVVYA